MAELAVYRLVPVRPPEDASWALVPYRGEVFVRAESSGEARALAALTLEKGNNSDPSARIDASYGSAFGDPNLYAVRRDHSGRFPKDGPKGVCAAPGQVADTAAAGTGDG